MNAQLSQIGPLVLVFMAGGVVALQAPTNGMLARAGGSPVLAALVSFAVGMAVLTAILIAGWHRWSAQPFAALPWYAWLGGPALAETTDDHVQQKADEAFNRLAPVGMAVAVVRPGQPVWVQGYG